MLSPEDVRIIETVLTDEQRSQYEIFLQRRAQADYSLRSDEENNEGIQEFLQVVLLYIKIFKENTFLENPGGQAASIACQLVNLICYSGTANLTTWEDAKIFYKFWSTALPVATLSFSQTDTVAPVLIRNGRD